MKYIYIDESGDLGDNYSSSKYFVVAAIILNNPKKFSAIIKKVRKRYRNFLHKSPEIKGNKTDRYIIKKILDKVNNVDCEVCAIFLDKQNLYKIPNFYHHHKLYDNLASKLAEKIKITSPTCVIVDKSKFNQDDILNFNDLFSSKLNNIDNHTISIIHGDSINYKGLQIADLISWSIFQCLEHDDSRYINKIQNKKIFEIYKN